MSLLSNFSFEGFQEGRIVGWFADKARTQPPTNFTRVALSPSQEPESNYSAYTVLGASNPSRMTNEFLLEVGKQYDIGMWFRLPFVPGGGEGFGAVENNDTIIYQVNSSNKGGWEYHEFTFTAQADDFTLVAANTDGRVYFDHIQVVEIVDPPEQALIQEGDVYLFETLDGDEGGEIQVNNGVTTMTVGIDTAFYMCLMGGNIDDNNTPDTDNKQWCGNEDEPELFKVRSRTQSFLKGAPLSSGKINDLKDAIAFDLNSGFGDLLRSIEKLEVDITGVNSILVKINFILQNGKEYQIERAFS